jgi:hypothetical protein
MGCICCDPCRGSCETAADCAEGCECVEQNCVSTPDPECCCDQNVGSVLAAGEECNGSTFPVPNPPLDASIVFQWCGLTTQRTQNVGTVQYYGTQNIDLFVCTTTGRYGGDESYTQASMKEISATLDRSVGSGGICGFSARYDISVVFAGTGFRKFGDGNFYGWETVIVNEFYDCWIRMCYDGSEPDVSMTLVNFTTDDTCGGTGCFDPCKFTPPEVTVVLAP